MRALLPAMFIMIAFLAGCGGDSADVQAKAASRVEQLNGVWSAYVMKADGKPALSMQLTIEADFAYRVTLAPEYVVKQGPVPVYQELTLGYNVIGQGPTFVMLNVEGGREVWKVTFVDDNTITIGATTFTRGADKVTKFGVERL